MRIYSRFIKEVNTVLKIQIKQIMKNRILLSVVFSIIFFGCKEEINSPAEAPKDYLEYGRLIEDGLVAYYPFDGNARDYGLNRYDAVESGVTTSIGRFGQAEGSYFFDGVNDYVEIPNFYELNGDSGTICFWGRIPLPYTGSINASIISKIDTVGSGYALSISDPNGFWFFFKDPVRSQSGTAIRSNYTSVERFFFFAFTFETYRMATQKITKIKRYSEDTSDEEIHTFTIIQGYTPPPNWQDSFNKNDQPIYIGKSLLSEYNFFLGEIDDLLIYNRALSRDEILALFNWE